MMAFLILNNHLAFPVAVMPSIIFPSIISNLITEIFLSIFRTITLIQILVN